MSEMKKKLLFEDGYSKLVISTQVYSENFFVPLFFLMICLGLFPQTLHWVHIYAEAKSWDKNQF